MSQVITGQFRIHMTYSSQLYLVDMMRLELIVSHRLRRQMLSLQGTLPVLHAQLREIRIWHSLVVSFLILRLHSRSESANGFRYSIYTVTGSIIYREFLRYFLTSSDSCSGRGIRTPDSEIMRLSGQTTSISRDITEYVLFTPKI